jgi:hypothetical protein
MPSATHGTWQVLPHYQPMVVSDSEKANGLYAMASNFRHAAHATSLPGYRDRLLQVARDLECEAAKLDDQRFFSPTSRDASRTG